MNCFSCSSYPVIHKLNVKLLLNHVLIELNQNKDYGKTKCVCVRFYVCVVL